MVEKRATGNDDHSNGTPTQQNDVEKQQCEMPKKVETNGQGHGTDGQTDDLNEQQILNVDEKQDNLEDLNKGNDPIATEEGNTKTASDDESSDSSESGNSEEESKTVTTGRKRKNKKKNKKIKEGRKKERKEENKKRKQQTKEETQHQNSGIQNAASPKESGTAVTLGDTFTTGNQVNWLLVKHISIFDVLQVNRRFSISQTIL